PFLVEGLQILGDAVRGAIPEVLHDLSVCGPDARFPHESREVLEKGVLLRSEFFSAHDTDILMPRMAAVSNGCTCNAQYTGDPGERQARPSDHLGPSICPIIRLEREGYASST